MNICAGARSHEQALFTRESARHSFRRRIGHSDHMIEERAIENGRDEPGPEAWNRMWTGPPARQRRACGWLDRDDDNALAEVLAKHPAAPGDRAARADTGDEGGDLALGLFEDLERRRRRVRLGVSRVLE